MDAALIASVRRIAREAGNAILQIYREHERGNAIALQHKSDHSPLTAADLAAHRLISTELAALTPEWPVLSEESAEVSFAERQQWQRFWLVDPLDGTKEFLSCNGEFTVNIALIDAHQPVFGVVHVPVKDLDYWGVTSPAVGMPVGAWRARQRGALVESICVARRTAQPVRVVGSRSHRGDSLDGFLSRLGPHELVSMGSSLKFCVLAEGAADVYPRLGPTSEWDTAAAHAVVQGAGGRVVQLDGSPLEYNCRDTWLNPHFIAYAAADRDWSALLHGSDQ
ncbi:MAG: 3'(2'),5'-bisphosphate nucleotidase CysQ [Sinobacteraceae bacterium]|nr:3'(2'),5'-bisphosphate nucleotidase CysQ [Nevskiaceae bacterium]